MRGVFADAVYWIALTHPGDQWHGRAVAASRALGGRTVVTTGDVFDELLAHFSVLGPAFRALVVATVEDAISDPSVVVIPQSHQTFLDGLALYKARPDKQYSLTDCISMEAMRQEGITEVLTHDIHFAKEGFTTLL
jgi:predicted nucleic acid-binding protein